MGIYDREYYRDDTRNTGWFSGVAPACKTLILINVVAYVLIILNHALQEPFEARSRPTSTQRSASPGARSRGGTTGRSGIATA